MNRSRTIRDLCGNAYHIKEAQDLTSVFLEVYEIVNIDGKEHTVYLFDIDMSFDSPDDDILDEIDDVKDKVND
jgi:hypothetical protein